jgi:hypothetical protein
MANATSASVPGAIELRLRDSSQLFNTLDPLPFRERDLAPDAVDYIVDWAEELPRDQPIRIVVHIQPEGQEKDAAPDLASALSTYFADRAKAETNEIRALFRDGRRAFAIGFALIVVVVAIGWQLSLSFSGALPYVVEQSLVVIGWVIIWRPAEMFLYGWVPMARRRKLYRRLAASTITVKNGPPAGA